jgi:hypothetical protein
VSHGGQGGGLYLLGESAAPGVPPSALANCTFETNRAGRVGGGMYAQDASPSFTDSNWRSNTPDDDTSGSGGGLDLVFDSAAPGAPPSALANCTFELNRAGYAGGGMYAQDASPSFVGCTWRSNTVGDDTSGLGGGLVLNGDIARTASTPLLHRFRIASSRQGGAIYNYQGNVTITGSTTFVNNTADDQVGVYPTFRSARADSHVCRLGCFHLPHRAKTSTTAVALSHLMPAECRRP